MLALNAHHGCTLLGPWTAVLAPYSVLINIFFLLLSSKFLRVVLWCRFSFHLPLRIERLLPHGLCCQLYIFTTGSKTKTKEKNQNIKKKVQGKHKQTNKKENTFLRVQTSSTNLIVYLRGSQYYWTKHWRTKKHQSSRALQLLIGNLTESLWPFILSYLKIKHLNSIILLMGPTGEAKSFPTLNQAHTLLVQNKGFSQVFPVRKQWQKARAAAFSAVLNISKLQLLKPRREHRNILVLSLNFHTCGSLLLFLGFDQRQSKACKKKKKG